MTGRDHVIAGTATIGIADGVVHGLSALSEKFLPTQSLVYKYHGMFLQGSSFFAKAGWAIGAAVLFYLGTLLPDIDTGESTIRKILHIQNKKVNEKWHRTWTHSVWPLLLLGVLMWQVSIFFWLFFGYLTHLIWDSVSAMGICWLYPFQKYLVYPSGARVVKGHKVKLYKTSELSEIWTVVFVVVVGLLCFMASHGDLKVSDFLVPLFV